MTRACMDTGRHEQALPMLEDIYHRNPERLDYGQMLARCQLRLGLLNEAERTVAACLEGFGDQTGAQMIRANTREQTERLRRESAARVPDLAAEGQRRLAEQRERAAASQSDMPKDQEFVFVSGLSRSGTSLMMQMLRAGGMELMTDGQRAADLDNPEGYWEWEEIKNLPKRPLLIEQAHGKATKVISALIPALPPKHKYKIIFMTRPVEEVVASQWQMLEHKGTAPKTERTHLETAQQMHALEVLAVLRQHVRVSLLEVDYPALVREPQTWAARIAEFLGDYVLTQRTAMPSVVKPQLHRQRGA